MNRRVAHLLTLALLAAAAPTLAQDRNIRPMPTPPPPPMGDMGQVVVVDPLPGNAAGFEEGIRRHLDWVRSAGSSWSWLGFEIIMGERTGQYMFGTFNHAYADWDTPDVDQQASGESFDRNVALFVDNATSSLIRLRPELSMATPGQAPRPLYEVITFQVKPGKDRAFEHFWVKFREAVEATALDGEYFIYQYAQGAPGGTWVVSIPHGSFAEMESPVGWMDTMFEEAFGAFEGQAILDEAGELLISLSSEIFQFRPDLSVNVPME